MLKINKSLFWDVNPDEIDFNTHKRFIISRILQRGTWMDFKALISFYGEKIVKREVIQIRYMDKKTLRFCSFYFQIAEDKFRCFKSIQLQKKL